MIKTIYVTQHCKQRYIEHIKGLYNKERDKYLIKNNNTINRDILKLYEHAELIYSGSIHSNFCRNFYIRDDIIIVTQINNSAIFTLYRVKFWDKNIDTKSTLLMVKNILSNIRAMGYENKEIKQIKKEILNEILDINSAQYKRGDILALIEKINKLIVEEINHNGRCM